MGYLVTFTSYAYASEYQGIVYEALGLTLLIIGVLTVLYTKGIIRVTGRFRKIVYTTLLVSILGERGHNVRQLIFSRPLPLRWLILMAFMYITLAFFMTTGGGSADFLYAVF